MKKTHDFSKELPEDSDQLVVHQLTTFDGWVLQAFDLLLHYNLKRSRADKERWG